MISEMTVVTLRWAGPLITPAASGAAHFIARESGQNWRRLNDSFSIGIGGSGVMDQLCGVYEQCAVPGWDGYDAAAISQEAYLTAYRLLEALPLGVPAPTVGAEPDGHLTFEWHRGARRTLSVSVSPDAELHYAALLGQSKVYGTEPFLGELPKTVLELIQRVYAE